MEHIFHEKQMGALCAQHCLNALLQGPNFNAVDLAEIAQGLDEYERQMAAFGTLSQQFIQGPSHNYDDTGFFSIQVLQKALEVWNLELVPYNSAEQISRRARENPSMQKGFICNMRQHWFTIRKIAHSWFDLNSVNAGPKFISDTYLSLYLVQLEAEGYSVFVVKGAIPDCQADQLIAHIPPNELSRLSSAMERPRKWHKGKHGRIDGALKRALEESKKVDSACKTSRQGSEDLEQEMVLEATRQDHPTSSRCQIDDDLQRAIELSKQAYSMSQGEPIDEDLERALELSKEANSVFGSGEIDKDFERSLEASKETHFHSLANQIQIDQATEDSKKFQQNGNNDLPSQNSGSTAPSQTTPSVDMPSADEIRKLRLKYLEKNGSE